MTLFCQGLCRPHVRFGTGSTAAYLLSAAGARTMVDMKVGYHADYVRNSLRFRTVLGPTLVGTHDPKGRLVGGQTLDFWLHQDVFRLAGCRVTTARALVLWAVLLAVAKQRPTRGGEGAGEGNALASSLVVLPLVLAHFFTYETQYYRCSRTTHLFHLLFPACVLMTSRQDDWQHRATRAMAQGMLAFHVLHELDR
jgi:hypothetical protein